MDLTGARELIAAHFAFGLERYFLQTVYFCEGGMMDALQKWCETQHAMPYFTKSGRRERMLTYYKDTVAYIYAFTSITRDTGH
jgi:hypothetical protein